MSDEEKNGPGDPWSKWPQEYRPNTDFDIAVCRFLIREGWMQTSDGNPTAKTLELLEQHGFVKGSGVDGFAALCRILWPELERDPEVMAATDDVLSQFSRLVSELRTISRGDN